jgi:aspartate 1-decarboxylase
MEELIHILKSKIHRAVVTQAELEYVGSITIDKNLMEAAGMYPFERVLVSNMRNGNRLETYIIEGEAGSGTICLNGPCAHLFHVGDEVVIMAFKLTNASSAIGFKPIVVLPEDGNKRWQLLS